MVRWASKAARGVPLSVVPDKRAAMGKWIWGGCSVRAVTRVRGARAVPAAQAARAVPVARVARAVLVRLTYAA